MNEVQHVNVHEGAFSGKKKEKEKKNWHRVSIKEVWLEGVKIKVSMKLG